MMRLSGWFVKGWGILWASPSRMEVVVLLLTATPVLVVPALRVQRQAAQVARREQLVQQGERFLEQMVGNLDRIERNLRAMHDLINEERMRLSQGALAIADPPPPIILPPDEHADLPPVAEPPSAGH